MALPCAWVSWPRLHAKSKLFKCLSHSNHFSLAVLQFPSNPDSQYIVYMVDSFQNPMDKDIQHILALLLMEIMHCEVDPTSALYEAEAVDKFKATCMRFVQVKVCHVVVQSSTHFSFTPSN